MRGSQGLSCTCKIPAQHWIATTGHFLSLVTTKTQKVPELQVPNRKTKLAASETGMSCVVEVPIPPGAMFPDPRGGADQDMVQGTPRLGQGFQEIRDARLLCKGVEPCPGLSETRAQVGGGRGGAAWPRESKPPPPNSSGSTSLWVPFLRGCSRQCKPPPLSLCLALPLRSGGDRLGPPASSMDRDFASVRRPSLERKEESSVLVCTGGILLPAKHPRAERVIPAWIDCRRRERKSPEHSPRYESFTLLVYVCMCLCV